jgi:hypothetical protein
LFTFCRLFAAKDAENIPKAEPVDVLSLVSRLYSTLRSKSKERDRFSTYSSADAELDVLFASPRAAILASKQENAAKLGIGLSDVRHCASVRGSALAPALALGPRVHAQYRASLGATSASVPGGGSAPPNYTMNPPPPRFSGQGLRM